MYQKWRREEWLGLKQALLIIQAHKYGKIAHTTRNVIYGH